MTRVTFAPVKSGPGIIIFDRWDTGHTQIPVSPNKPQSAEVLTGLATYFPTFLGIHESVSASRLPISRHGCVQQQQLAAIACSCKSQLCISAPDPANSHSTLEMRRRPRQKNYESTAAGWLQCSVLGPGPPVQSALSRRYPGVNLGWGGAQVLSELGFIVP